MREILFRGKDTDGVWHEGFYCIFNEKIHRIYTGYAEVDCGEYYSDFYFYTVIPETVGQYTGLTDKNGTRIFEGDVLELVVGAGGSHEYKTRGVIIADEWNCSCCYGVYGFSTDPINGYTTFDLREYDRSAVIGNIHDNPELLGSEYE